MAQSTSCDAVKTKNVFTPLCKFCSWVIMKIKDGKFPLQVNLLKEMLKSWNILAAELLGFLGESVVYLFRHWAHNILSSLGWAVSLLLNCFEQDT
jgi:hypothetical protein